MAASMCGAPGHLWHTRCTCMCWWPMGREGEIGEHVNSEENWNLEGCFFFKETRNNLYTEGPHRTNLRNI